MAQPPAEVTQLARRLVTAEAGGSVDPAALAEAVDTLCRRLRDYLTHVLGTGGVVALMGRALNSAKREQPFWPGLRWRGPSACFTASRRRLAADP
jgi:hypothetical protein